MFAILNIKLETCWLRKWNIKMEFLKVRPPRSPICEEGGCNKLPEGGFASLVFVDALLGVASPKSELCRHCQLLAAAEANVEVSQAENPPSSHAMKRGHKESRPRTSDIRR